MYLVTDVNLYAINVARIQTPTFSLYLEDIAYQYSIHRIPCGEMNCFTVCARSNKLMKSVDNEKLMCFSASCKFTQKKKSSFN